MRSSIAPVVGAVDTADDDWRKIFGFRARKTWEWLSARSTLADLTVFLKSIAPQGIILNFIFARDSVAPTRLVKRRWRRMW
eukprot:9091411-Alexandrium_andersonii.AAC.1